MVGEQCPTIEGVCGEEWVLIMSIDDHHQDRKRVYWTQVVVVVPSTNYGV